jgi:hypothetical protein
MFGAGQFFRASVNAAQRLLRPAWFIRRSARALVPIRSLGPSHAPRILAHLLSLSPRDRYLRLGHVASDGPIQRYVEQLNFERDGSKSECYLRLPPADIDSRITELLLEQIAQTDDRPKAQARQFRDALKVVQEVRQGVRDARERNPI